MFLNGKNLGIQLVPPFTYTLSDYLKDGKNKLVIEVATTAARDVNKRIKSWILKKVFPIELERSGIIGEVFLNWREEV